MTQFENGQINKLFYYLKKKIIKSLFQKVSDYQSFRILYRKEYDTSKLTLATQKELLFGIKQIGNLIAIDVNKGDEFFVKIDLLPDIRKIFISQTVELFSDSLS